MSRAQANTRLHPYSFAKTSASTRNANCQGCTISNMGLWDDRIQGACRSSNTLEFHEFVE